MGQMTDFTVNGQRVTVEADPATPLLTILHESLGLRATRFGCGAEGCGACTLIVDGQARLSCTLPLSEVAGTRIETAENLAGPDPHPLVTAFQDHQAGQCGYCLPGILMRAKAHLDAGGATDRASIAAALDANLCRCGAHLRILRAVAQAADKMGQGA